LKTGKLNREQYKYSNYSSFVIPRVLTHGNLFDAFIQREKDDKMKRMSLKRRLSLALPLTKTILVAIFEGIWFSLSIKAKKLVNSLFKTPSSRIGFHCVVLMLL